MAEDKRYDNNLPESDDNIEKRHYTFLDLGVVNDPHKEAMKEAACRVIDSGHYVGGDEVAAFESELASICNVPYAVGVSNGLDALRLILRGYIELGQLAPGDEVVVPADTYVASVLAITDNGLKPLFADVDLDTRNITADSLRKVLTPHTKAVMLVHLYGRVCWDKELETLVRDRNLIVVEDNAQAITAKSDHPGLFGTCVTGGLGDAAGISFYPTKNLGALGDAGAVTTHDKKLADMVRALRNYGSERQYTNIYAGLNCRLDPIQAAMIRVKIPSLSADNEHRRTLARIYGESIVNPAVRLPLPGGDNCIWHQYVVLVENRDGFRKYLLDNGVETGVHYPVPPFKQPCYSEYSDCCCPNAETIAEQCVSLPISTCTSPDDAKAIAEIINRYHP